MSEISDTEVDSIIFNIGQMLTPKQLEKVKEACQKAYNLGDDAGYKRAYIGSLQAIGILCNRAPNNELEISDSEMQSLNGIVDKHYNRVAGITTFTYEGD